MKTGALLNAREVKLQSEADHALRQFWLQETFLTWQWWLLLAITLVPWLIWWKIADRKRLFEIWTYGSFIMLTSIIFDAIGVEFDLWEYKHQLVPLFDVFISYDMSVMPVVYMIIYQKYGRWKDFIIAHLIVSVLFAFVSEPLLVWLDFYTLMKWSYGYSSVIYFLMAVFYKGFLGVLLRKTRCQYN